MIRAGRSGGIKIDLDCGADEQTKTTIKNRTRSDSPSRSWALHLPQKPTEKDVISKGDSYTTKINTAFAMKEAGAVDKIKYPGHSGFQEPTTGANRPREERFIREFKLTDIARDAAMAIMSDGTIPPLGVSKAIAKEQEKIVTRRLESEWEREWVVVRVKRGRKPGAANP